MSMLKLTRGATPPAPAADKIRLYEDTADRRIKTIDDLGVISILTDDGWQDQNILINGGFCVAQRQVPTTLTPYSSLGGRVYSADRWCISNEAASTQFQQVDTSGTPEAGLAARNYGKFKKVTALGKFAVIQVIEAINCLHTRGTTVRLQLKMKYSVAASMTVRLGLLQLANAGTVDTVPIGVGLFITTWGGVGTDPTLGANLAYLTPVLAEGGTISGNGVTCVLTNAWVRYSATFTIPSNCKNLIAMIWTNGQPAINDELNMSEAGIYSGQEIKEWQPYAIKYTLSQCQRYYVKTFPLLTAPAQNAGVAGALRNLVAIAGAVATSSVIQWRFPTMMRVAPTTNTAYNPSAANAYLRNVPAATDATVTGFTSASTDCVDINATGLAAWTVGQEIKVHATCDAEL